MSSPESDWSLVSSYEKGIENTQRTQAALLESANNVASMRRLGTSRTQYQMGEPGTDFGDGLGLPPPPPLMGSTLMTAPAPVPAATAIPNRRESKKAPPTSFPKMGDGEKDTPKGSSFTRKIKTSILGGKNPFTSTNKNYEKEKKETVVAIPPTQSPEPDAVFVQHPDMEPNVSRTHQSAPPELSKSSRLYQHPPVAAHTRTLNTSPSQTSTQASGIIQGQSSRRTAPEAMQHERPPSRPRDIPIIELPSRRSDNRSEEPPLGVLQTHRSASGSATYAPATSSSGSVQTEIRPLPQLPIPASASSSKQSTPVPSASRSYQAATATLGALANPLPTPPVSVPVPALEPNRSTHSERSRYRDTQTSQQQPQHNQSSPPVVRYQTSSDRASRTSYVTTATTPSFSSSSRTRASTSDIHPPKDMERTPWAAAPPTRPPPPISHHHRAASVDQVKVSPEDGWNDSMAQLSLRTNQPHQQHQPGYHVEMPSNYRNAPPPTNQATRPHKLQRHATTANSAPTPVVTYVYYDSEPPLISRTSRLSDLKEDYRNPGSERSDIIRRKINYLRFELGYTGLRRARGDGNCFYRSFVFAYLEQIYFADDRAVAVISALEHLEMAQNIVDLAVPGRELSENMYPFLQGLIRGMELRTVDQKSLLKVFQNRRESDDLVAYVRLIASAYIRLTPEMHASVFHPDDPSVVISPSDFCAVYVEQLGQDADHIQISALSRALNVAVYIYRLDERIDGKAPNEQDIPAHCTRFIPPDLPPATDPVTLLFRPGHYDILERHHS